MKRRGWIVVYTAGVEFTRLTNCVGVFHSQAQAEEFAASNQLPSATAEILPLKGRFVCKGGEKLSLSILGSRR